MDLEESGARASGGGGGCSAGGPDRLSALPDCLLHTIMSFMKARQVVQTCALSTRWRHLWRAVPCLDVYLEEFKRTARASDDNSGSGGGDDSSDSGDNSDSDLDSSDANDDDNNHDDSSESGDDTPDSDDSSSDSDLDSSDTTEDDNNHKDKDWEDFAVNLMLRCSIAQLDSFRLHIVGSRAPAFGDRHAAGWLRRAMKYCVPDRASPHEGLSSGSWRLKRLHLCHVQLDNGFVKHVSSVCSMAWICCVRT